MYFDHKAYGQESDNCEKEGSLLKNNSQKN